MKDIFSSENSEVAATLARTSSPHHRHRWGRLLTAVILVVGVLALLFWWQSGTPTASPQYQTQPVKRGDLKVIVTATGNLAPVNQVEVGSELSGIIRSVAVDYNDHVRVGQVLARLDTSKLEAQMLQARANLEVSRAKVLQTRATVQETSQNLERLQTVLKMSQGKAVSKQDQRAGPRNLGLRREELGLSCWFYWGENILRFCDGQWRGCPQHMWV